MSDYSQITPYPYPDDLGLFEREFEAADAGALDALTDYEVVTGNPQVQMSSGYSYWSLNINNGLATAHAISRYLPTGLITDPWFAEPVSDYPNSGLCFAVQANGDCHVAFGRTSPSRQLVIGKWVSGSFTELATMAITHTTKTNGFLDNIQYDGAGTYRIWETWSKAVDVTAPAGHIGLYHHAFATVPGSTGSIRGFRVSVYGGTALPLLPENAGLLLNLHRHLNQNDWYGAWETQKPLFARTDDGVIHYISWRADPNYGEEQLGYECLWHHRSYDNGASFVSELLPDYEDFNAVVGPSSCKCLQITTDGTRLMLLFKTGYSNSDVYQQVWDGNWGALENTWVYAQYICSAFFQGAWHLLVNSTERYVYDETDGWLWQEDIPNYDEGELGLVPWRSSGTIVVYGNRLAFGYIVGLPGNDNFGRYCVQFFDGTSWSTAEIIDSMDVGSGGWDDWVDCPYSAIALHASHDGHLYAAWVFTPWDWPDVDFRNPLEIREHNGTEWLPTTIRRYGTCVWAGYVEGVFLTPALASDRAGNVYCFVGCYPPSYGNGVVYTMKPAGGGWSDSYGEAAVDSTETGEVIFQPQSAFNVYLNDGVLFEVYQNSDDYGPYDGTLLFRIPEVAVVPDPLPDIHHLWVFNTQERLQCVYSNFNIESCPYLDDAHIERLDGYESYEFTIPTQHTDAKFTEPEGFVAFPDLDRKLRMYRIKSVSDVVSVDATRTRRVTCEPVALELLEAIVRPVTFTSQWPQDILADLLAGTRWSVGQVDYGPLTTHSWRDYRSVWAALVELAATTGMLLRSWVTIEGNVVTGRHIDLLTNPDNVTGKFLDYTKDTAAITRTQHSPALYTALIGLGRAKADSSFVTFTDVVWTTPVAKPAEQDWVGDETARERYGLVNETGENYHRWGVYQLPDESEAGALLTKTWAALQTVNRPRFSYEVSVVALERMREQRPGSGEFAHEKMRLGDVVAVRDFSIEPPIVATEVVVETQRCYTDPTRDTVTLGMARNKLTTTLADLMDLRKRVYNKEGIWSGWTGS